ncbi:ceramide glucosyltransferase [Acidisoma sp. C75]
MSFAQAAALYCAAATCVNLTGLAIAARRLPRPGAAVPPPSPTEAAGVTIIRPLCRINNFERETLRSTFELDYPAYEILFCVEDEDDPVIGLVHRLMAEHPAVPAQLLIGRNRSTANPKLNNCLKAWDAARFPWVIMADSNVLMPRDYIQQMMSRWQADSGLVCSMPIGAAPADFGAELECAFLNTFQARWQYVGEALGHGFAQGKSMLMQRALVDEAGGLLRALGTELAEDAAFTKLVRAAGRKVHLVDHPFPQPLGTRRVAEVWSRQARWAMLRRSTFPLMFAPEVLTGACLPMIAGISAAWAANINVAMVAAGLFGLWYGPELLLARRSGWFVSSRLLLAFALRDCLFPAVWAYAWARRDYVWRGNAVRVQPVMAEELE